MRNSSTARIYEARSGQDCILVVEDETIIRWAVADALRDAGYSVIEAVNGDEAVSIIRIGVPLDLVFSDVRMPGSLDGLALLDTIKRSVPQLPVLLTSGHCDPTLALDRGAARFVQKPYDLATVLAIVEDELGKA